MNCPNCERKVRVVDEKINDQWLEYNVVCEAHGEMMISIHDPEGAQPRPNDIEYCTMMKSLPVNSKAMLSRLNELMEIKETNCLAGIRDDWAVKSVMWLLMSQVFGQLATIKMDDLWQELNDVYTSREV